MAVQDDHMIRNIQDVGRLIAKLLLHEQQPNYKLPEKEADYTEADRLFATIMKLAEEGKINEAENELYMGMVEDDVDYLELALTFYLYLCSWIHMMYTDCRQDYRNQQSSFYRNIWNWE